MRQECARISRVSGGSDLLESERRALAQGLLEAECLMFGRFTLKSGLESPIYIDLRRLVAYPCLVIPGGGRLHTSCYRV